MKVTAFLRYFNVIYDKKISYPFSILGNINNLVHPWPSLFLPENSVNIFVFAKVRESDALQIFTRKVCAHL